MPKRKLHVSPRKKKTPRVRSKVKVRPKKQVPQVSPKKKKTVAKVPKSQKKSQAKKIAAQKKARLAEIRRANLARERYRAQKRRSKASREGWQTRRDNWESFVRKAAFNARQSYLNGTLEGDYQALADAFNLSAREIYTLGVSTRALGRSIPTIGTIG